jgi:hypothetical protein
MKLIIILALWFVNMFMNEKYDIYGRFYNVISKFVSVNGKIIINKRLGFS